MKVWKDGKTAYTIAKNTGKQIAHDKWADNPSEAFWTTKPAGVKDPEPPRELTKGAVIEAGFNVVWDASSHVFQSEQRAENRIHYDLTEDPTAGGVLTDPWCASMGDYDFSA